VFDLSTLPDVRSSPAPDRRRHPRLRVIDTNIVPVDLGHDRRGLLVDLSMSGASVHPYGILQLGETSVMQFSFPDSGTRFEATGVVAWVNPSGRVGIEFTNVPSPARINLNAWIEGASAISSGLPTQATSQVAAAYLPSSYSPWIKVSDVMRDSVSGKIEEDLARCDLVSALRLLLDRARSLTRASGAAIALADGSDVVCRARSGVAPDLGARFKPDAGLSGEAVRTGATVLCSDTNEDPRVDRVACQHLNIRSVLIEPILNGDVVIGVIEVFAASPKSFDDRDTAHLKRLADLIAAMLDSNTDIKPRGRRIQ
jgi:Tfp pilus assembly protein PilZ